MAVLGQLLLGLDVARQSSTVHQASLQVELVAKDTSLKGPKARVRHYNEAKEWTVVEAKFEDTLDLSKQWQRASRLNLRLGVLD